jgi:hypothetical protein
MIVFTHNKYLQASKRGKKTKMNKEIINPRGHTWDEVEKKLFTPEEIAECDLKVALIGETVKHAAENIPRIYKSNPDHWG